MSTEQPYPDVPSRADYPAIEERILNRWAEEDTFAASIEERPEDNEYVFYDGPPFANGLPHYGHLLTSYVKDVIPRYRTMKGERVDRRFGWDCHGLPAEMVTEKELDVSGRKAIEDYGIDRFNDACRTSVLQYTDQWEHYVTRMGRWVDFDNDYKTMDLPYMESVIWAFKQLWDKGLVYEDARVMPYSWGAQTPLSNFEIRMDDATRPRQDPAITVAFELTEPLAVEGRDDLPTSILIWTTTPWTLPSNLAVAVGPDVEYGLVELADDRTVHLTDTGRSLATDVLRKHRLAERLLVDVLGVEHEHVHEEACRWEHVISDRVAEKLEDFLGNPTTSPYGNPIPGSDDSAEDEKLQHLSEVRPGRVRIVRISEQLQGDPEVMHALGNAKVYAGMEVDVALTGAGFELRHTGGTVTVDGDAAHLLYVVPLDA